MLDTLFSIYCWSTVAIGTAALWAVGTVPVYLLTAWWDEERLWCHWVCTFWGHALIWINPQWQVETFDRHKIPRDRPVILISNHQGMGDIMLAYQLRTQFRWIAKEILFKIPFLGWSMASAGYIALRRGDAASIRTCMDRARWYLEHGVSVLFFPEGTRSRDGTLLPFKAGAFKLAIESGRQLVPIGVAGARDALPTNSWKFPRRQSRMRIKVGDPISPNGYGDHDVEKLISVCRVAIENLKSEVEEIGSASDGRSI